MDAMTARDAQWLHDHTSTAPARTASFASVLTGAVLLGSFMFLNEAVLRVADVEQFSFDWQVALRFGMCALCGLYGLYHLPRTGDQLVRFPGAFCLLFGVWALATVPFSIDAAYSFGACVALWCMMLFAPAVLQQLGERRLVLATIVALLLYLGVSWIVSFLFPEFGRMEYVGANREMKFRLGGLNHPNGLGRQAALAVAMLLVAGTARYVKWKVLLLPLAFAVITLLFTDSRTSMLAMCAAAMVLYVRKAKPSVVAFSACTVGAVFCFAVLLISLGFVDFQFERLLTGASRSNDAAEITSLHGRTFLWQFAIDKIFMSPVFGYGFGCSRFVIVSEHSFVTRHAHNLLLNVMLEVGFIGGLLLIAMFLRQFWDMLFRPNSFPDAVTALVLVGGLGDLIMFNAMPKSQTLMWLIALFWRQLAGSTSERTGGSCK